MIITAKILTNIELIIGHNCKAGVGMMPARFGMLKLTIVTTARRPYDGGEYKGHTHKFHLNSNTPIEDIYQHFRAIKPKFDKALAIT